MFKPAFILLNLAILTGISMSQGRDESKSKKTVLDLTTESAKQTVSDFRLKSEDASRRRFMELSIHLKENTVKNERTFDIISAFSDNISFGGFWDRFAVINFAPRFNVKPSNYIVLSGNYNLSCLVPLNSIKLYSKSVILQGMLVLAVDNAIRLVAEKRGWIVEMISYAAKNILINTFIKKVIQGSTSNNEPMYDYEYFNYSVSIRF